jgi:hypothetical protein
VASGKATFNFANEFSKSARDFTLLVASKVLLHQPADQNDSIIKISLRFKCHPNIQKATSFLKNLVFANFALINCKV